MEVGTAAAVLDGVRVLAGGATGVVEVVVFGNGETVEVGGTTTWTVVVVVEATGVVLVIA